jgi:hypothetical protein
MSLLVQVSALAHSAPHAATAAAQATSPACGIGLLALGDAHGGAVIGGLVIGVLVSAISPPGSILTPAGLAHEDRFLGRQEQPRN